MVKEGKKLLLRTHSHSLRPSLKSECLNEDLIVPELEEFTETNASDLKRKEKECSEIETVERSCNFEYSLTVGFSNLSRFDRQLARYPLEIQIDNLLVVADVSML